MAGLRDPIGDPIGILAATACAAALTLVAPIATCVALAFVLLAVASARVGRPRTALLAAFVFALAAWRASSTVSRFESAREAVIRAGPGRSARVTLAGTVASSPVTIGDAQRLDVDVCAPFVARVGLHVPQEDAPALARGDRVEVIAQLAPLDRFWNEGSTDPRIREARRGVVLSGGVQSIVVVERAAGARATIDRLRDRVRRRIRATFASDVDGMARALVLGEDDVANDDRRAFQKSGLAHLLAVSGMHLVLVVASFVLAVRALLLRVPAVAMRCDVWRIASVCGLPLVWLYADFAGGSGSAIRAAWMTTAALVARIVDRRPDAWRAASLAIAAVTIADPLAAFDLSFVLSAFATAGLLWLARPIQAALLGRVVRFVAPSPDRAFEVARSWRARLAERLSRSAPARVVTTALATTIAATVACTPVLAFMSPDMPVGSVLANVVAVPVGEATALPLCLAHALLAPWPAAESGCALAASGALAIVRAVARAFAGTVMPIPMPTSAQLAAVIATISVALMVPRFRRRWVVLAGTAVVVALEIGARIEGAPHGVLRATFVDVGQGDASLIDLPDGSAMMIDGGGIVGSPVDVGERALAPLLRARRRSRIDVVVLTHPHPDHFLGLASALERVEVGELWDTGQGEAEGAGPVYEALLARMRARGVRIVRPNELCGTHTRFGVTIDVLAPCPDVSGDHGPNDNSFVVRLRLGTRAMLFAGDAEHWEESVLLSGGAARVRADVLKVGHHGSRTSSTPAFVDAVRPSVAVVSCGVRNRFGHPHPTTLATLLKPARGIRVYRTDHDGEVVVTTDGEEVQSRSTTPM